ncbi:hypothetical protein PIROE2DRAFT_17448 [Piromyces sp. E2]|nr:hypothetical protein PIROE2DRAFT_17448 [Piromyces sp. E2]|eukprot:OUM57544.1 hypothetical protein PIROE2DRAFT_17448 [Piromyces sp. E2]
MSMVYPPSCVEDAIPCHFTSPTARNLIVVKASTIEIYEVLEVTDEEEKKFWIGKDSKDQDKTNDQIYPKIRAGLELVTSYKIHGNVSSINCIRTTTNVGLLGMDSLLVSFKDAKMSLLEWSNAIKDIITISLHYYEREEFQDVYLSASTPEIRVDPLNRCAALKFYYDQIAILPFKQEVAGGVASTYIDEDMLKEINENQYERDSSRLAQLNDTCSLVVVSLDLTQHIYPVLFSVDHLPYNCFKLISVPSPVGGILVVSQNGLVYIDQTSVPGISLGLNEYFGIEKELSTRSDDPSANLLQKSLALQPKNPLYSSRMTNFKYLGVTLDASVSCFLNPDTLLFILKEGDVLIVEMVGNEGDGHGWARKKNGISKFRVAKCGIKTTPPICLCKVGQELNSDGIDRWKNENKGTGYLFVGSRVDDSMLLQYQEFEILDIVEEESEEKKATAASTSTKEGDKNEPVDDLYNLSQPATEPPITEKASPSKENADDSSSETDFYNINIPFDPAAEVAATNTEKDKEKNKKESTMKIDDDTLEDGNFSFYI